MKIDPSVIELIKLVFAFLGVIIPSFFAWKSSLRSKEASLTSKENKVTIEKVSKSIDGMLEDKEKADIKIGKDLGKQELIDASKPIKPKD